MASENVEQVPALQTQPASEVNAGCPACGCEISHPLGTLDTKEEAVECMSCGTAWIPSRSVTAAKDPLAIGLTDDLARDMKKFAASPVTLAAARRLRSIEHLVSDGAFGKQRVLFSVGGLILASIAAGWELVSSNAISATFIKKVTK